MEAENKALKEDNAKLRDTLDKLVSQMADMNKKFDQILAENAALRRRLEDRTKPAEKSQEKNKEEIKSKAPAKPKQEEKEKDKKIDTAAIKETEKEKEASQKRQRKPENTTDTETEDGFEKAETRKARKARKRTSRLVVLQKKPEETEMETEETTKPEETSITGNIPAIVPTGERKTPEVPVWPTPRQTEDKPSEQGGSTNAVTHPKQTNPMSPPPIVVHDSKRWNEISRGLEARKIGYNKARLTRDGIYIYANNEEEWRKATRYMEEFRLEFHTFTLKKEIPLHAVIRGIPENVEDADVAADLTRQGFEVLECHRMTSRKTRQILPLFLVKVPKDQDKIYALRTCVNLIVRAEPQRINKKEIRQCHRCQYFGHAQRCCHATARCVKCGEQHETRECQKQREEPAKCANCLGAHPASYRGCRMFPKPRPSQSTGNRPRQTESQRPRQQTAQRKPAPKAQQTGGTS
ncbi:uncharacterized protein [Leptinotarsa decemlineata]|uniref:uncharacterized protein n=1 Tax=Leptinotarsa decemlineata TaxID=7539 RepID=UPI003D305D59